MTAQTVSGTKIADSRRSASDAVFYGILQSLEQRKLVPGQRLTEMDLCRQFGIGRNSVREGLQRLEAMGIIELNPHKGAAIRALSSDEAIALLDVAEAMTALAARLAARNIATSSNAQLLRDALEELRLCQMSYDDLSFSRARRHFYRAILKIADNPELSRLFPTMQVHVVHFQYQSHHLSELRFNDYALICAKVLEGDESAAEAAGRDHVRNVKKAIVEEEQASEPSALQVNG